MNLLISKCVTAVKVSNFSGHYLRNHLTLDIGVLGYIGIAQHKEHSPEVLSIPPGTPCIYIYIYWQSWVPGNSTQGKTGYVQDFQINFYRHFPSLKPNSGKDLQLIFFSVFVVHVKIRPGDDRTFLMVKVKQSRNRPGVAQRVPGGLGSHISWHSTHEGGKVFSLTHRPSLSPRNVFDTHFH